MSPTASLFCDELCSLGEGAFWHPLRNELFWFDINAGVLFGADPAGTIHHRIEFVRPASAAALIDFHNLAIAAQGELLTLDIDAKTMAPLHEFEPANPLTRSNDGRVSPSGVWWVSTMGKNAEHKAGTIYAFAEGQLAPVVTKVTIPNAICFSPDGKIAYYTDTPTRRILSAQIDPTTTKPLSDWQLFVELEDGPGAPDGAITDSQGNVWSAEYGGGRVVRYTPDGRLDLVVNVPARNVTCPTLGGADLKTLFVTTARQGLDESDIESAPYSGAVFAIDVDVPGRAEVPLRL